MLPNLLRVVRSGRKKDIHVEESFKLVIHKIYIHIISFGHQL